MIGVADLLGTRLGDFEVTGFLGQGGMAMVFRGKGPGGDEVALKVLPPERSAEDEHARARFHREMEQARALEHPNLVRVREVGDHEGMLFYAMDIVEGTPLDRYLEEVGLPRFDVAVHVLKGVCKGLAYLHERQLVHRDLKPGNIFLTGDAGDVVIGDYGLLKPLGVVDDLTDANERVGTPAYMSPEQFKGKDLDPRSDIYQLGVLLYRLLTGRVPFHEPNFFKLGLQHLNKRPLKPRALNPEIPPELEAVILRCLAKDPAERYEDAGSLSRDLNRYFVRQATREARGTDLRDASVQRPMQSLDPRERLPVPAPARGEGWVARLGEAGGRVLAGIALAAFAWVPLRVRWGVAESAGAVVLGGAVLGAIGSRWVRDPGRGADLAAAWLVVVMGWLAVEQGLRGDGAALRVLAGIEVGFLLWTSLTWSRLGGVAWQWKAAALLSAAHGALFLPEVLAGSSLEQVVRGEAKVLARSGLAYLRPLEAPFTYARLAHLPLASMVSIFLAVRELRQDAVERGLRHVSEAALAVLLAVALGRAAAVASSGVLGVF